MVLHKVNPQPPLSKGKIGGRADKQQFRALVIIVQRFSDTCPKTPNGDGNYDVEQEQTVRCTSHVVTKEYQRDLNIPPNVCRIKVPKV